MEVILVVIVVAGTLLGYALFELQEVWEERGRKRKMARRNREYDKVVNEQALRIKKQEEDRMFDSGYVSLFKMEPAWKNPGDYPRSYRSTPAPNVPVVSVVTIPAVVHLVDVGDIGNGNPRYSTVPLKQS